MDDYRREEVDWDIWRQMKPMLFAAVEDAPAAMVLLSLLKLRTPSYNFHWWWRPPAACDYILRPIGANEQREISTSRRGQPVCALDRVARLVCLHVDCDRAARAVLEISVLGADRVALDRVWCEEVILIVDRQRPEPLHRRHWVKGHGVAAAGVEASTGGIEILVDVFRFDRLVSEDD